MQARLKYILFFQILLLGLVNTLTTSAQQAEAKGGYGDMLYPYANDYSQTLSYKISVDYGLEDDSKSLSAIETLNVIKRIDNLTRGIPKIVYLVGWQHRGLDTGYPSFLEINPVLKRDKDSTALESLRWLMREAPKFHTLISLHVNFSDCYIDDNALGPKYIDRDIIVRETDGRHREGYEWNNHMAYRASNYRNWYQGTFRIEQIDPLFTMIPELRMSGSLHPDAWYNVDNPYYQVDRYEDCLAMREMTVYVREKYNVDLTTEFDWGRPKGEDFVLYHPMIWHIGWNPQNPPDPMKVPSYFMTGGDAFFWGGEKLAKSGKFFGHSATLEAEINENPETIPGGLKTFATRTLPWYFLNRLLRDKFNGDTAWFSSNVTVTHPEKIVIKQSGNFLQDGNDVFIPALWKSHREIIAYSEHGYKNWEWKFPETWDDVRSVDIYRLTINGLELKKHNLKIVPEKKLQLSLNADEAVSIVPLGIDPTLESEITPSGEVVFMGLDRETKGSWKKQYGSEGYIIPGIGEEIPGGIDIKLINGETHIWENETMDIQALENPNEGKNIAAIRSHPLHEVIDFNFNDDEEHNVAIFFLDWNKKGRWAVVDMIDPDSQKVLHSYNLTDFAKGVYLKYKIRGRLQCRITNVWTQRYQKSTDAGFSAIFFDPPLN